MATTLVKHDGKLLLDAGSRHFDNLLPLFLSINDNNEILRDQIGCSGCHTDSYPLNLVWLDVKLIRLDFKSWLGAHFFLQ